MSLIKCPECKKKISNQSAKCPNCGYPISEDLVEDESNYKKSKKTIMLIISVIIVIILGIFLFKGYTVSKYNADVYNCVTEMLDGAAKAEDAAYAIHDVWYNTIFEEEDKETDKYTHDENGRFNDDFNDSLSALYEDEKFQKDLNEINDNLISVNEQIAGLHNPPKECEEEYKAFMKFYDEYYELMQLALNSTGSLTTYTQELNETDKNCLDAYNKVMIYIE